MTYRDELARAMSLVAEHPRSIFIGQAVSFDGTSIYGTLKHIDPNKRLELPVMEDAQMGIATGLALAADLPICIYPRINFMILALNQLVLHLDTLPRFSDYRPKVIIRTMVATSTPLDPGPQHLGDFSYAIEDMLQTVKVVRLRLADQIVPQYREALAHPGSSLMIEYAEYYDNE